VDPSGYSKTKDEHTMWEGWVYFLPMVTMELFLNRFGMIFLWVSLIWFVSVIQNNWFFMFLRRRRLSQLAGPMISFHINSFWINITTPNPPGMGWLRRILSELCFFLLELSWLFTAEPYSNATICVI
jgi:hypothetical protein